MSKTHWKQLMNPDYLGAYALPEGRDITVTIRFVQREEVTGEGGKKEMCSVAQIENSKPLILNATNQKSITKMYGPFIEGWVGKQITLYVSQTKLRGELVECLRIRPSVASNEKPAINSDRLSKAISKIKSNDYSFEKLKSQFKLMPEQIAKVEYELQC